jgi:hypothetical protein
MGSTASFSFIGGFKDAESVESCCIARLMRSVADVLSVAGAGCVEGSGRSPGATPVRAAFI